MLTRNTVKYCSTRVDMKGLFKGAVPFWHRGVPLTHSPLFALSRINSSNPAVSCTWLLSLLLNLLFSSAFHWHKVIVWFDEIMNTFELFNAPVPKRVLIAFRLTNFGFKGCKLNTYVPFELLFTREIPCTLHVLTPFPPPNKSACGLAHLPFQRYHSLPAPWLHLKRVLLWLKRVT